MDGAGTAQPVRGSVGTLVGVNSPPVTEMLSSLGFDFIFLDLEHGGIDDGNTVNHVMASRRPVMLRLADSTELCVKRAADAGSDSILVPHVRDRHMAQHIVSWAKYPPAGTRSVGLARNSLLGYQLAEAMRDSSKPAVYAQIEDADGLQNIEEICLTAGLAGVFIGPFDLSASLGEPGNTQSSEFHAAVERIVEAAHRQDLTVGIFAGSVSAWQGFRNLGCDYVVLGADSIFMADSAVRALAEARALEDS